jgi:hypothetical protein
LRPPPLQNPLQREQNRATIARRKAAEAAIKESFEKFENNKSGLLDQQEFERAMYTLGLRLNADKYCEIFQKCDEDRSGDVDIHEFMHMIKCLLKKSCSSTCPVCLRDGGSNLLSAYFRDRWDDDETKWAQAASTLQAFTIAKPVLASYAQFVQEKTAASTLQAFVAAKSTQELYIQEIQEERDKNLRAEYQARWDEDETKWAQAASTLQAFVNAKPAQASYSQVVQEVAAFEDAIEAATAAIVQVILVEEQEVVVQEAIEEEVAAAAAEEIVVMGGDEVIPRGGAEGASGSARSIENEHTGNQIGILIKQANYLRDADDLFRVSGGSDVSFQTRLLSSAVLW